MTRVKQYTLGTKKKLPSVRSFTESSVDFISDYERAADRHMHSEIKNFLIEIHRSKKTWKDKHQSKETQRAMLMQLIAIRESLHTIFTRIWSDVSFSDEELDTVMRDFQGACFHSLHDIPLLIEEVEDNDPDGSIDSFIEFLQVVSEKIDSFFTD